MKINKPKDFIAYIGSKKKIIPYILDLIPDDVETVLDGFSGSTRVSQALAPHYNVITNDYVSYSRVLSEAFLFRTEDYSDLIDEMNALEPVFGWFSASYSVLQKQPYQLSNIMRLDAIRQRIDEYEGIEESVLLASLLLGLESVSNNLGHYSSYLREFSKRSYNDLILFQPRSIHFQSDLIDSGNKSNGLNKNLIGSDKSLIQSNKNLTPKEYSIYQKDIFDLLEMGLDYDLSYYDIPYGSGSTKMPSSRVRYKQYYHLLETIVRNDKPELFGKVGRRVDDRECSVFEEFRKDEDGKFFVQDSIEKLLNATKSKYTIFSYNNSGRLPIPDLMELIGTCQVIEIPHKGNVMGGMSWTNEWGKDSQNNVEYLFLKGD